MTGDIFGELLIDGVGRNDPAKADEDLYCAVFLLVLSKEFGVAVVIPTILRVLEVDITHMI